MPPSVRPISASLKAPNPCGQWAMGNELWVAGWAMGNGQWSKGNGQWALGNGHWAIGIGHGALGSGHWAMGNGHWALGIGRWALGNLRAHVCVDGGGRPLELAVEKHVVALHVGDGGARVGLHVAVEGLRAWLG